MPNFKSNGGNWVGAENPHLKSEEVVLKEKIDKAKAKLAKIVVEKTAGEAKKAVVDPVEVKPNLDINSDGKVDEKDASLAGKVLADAKSKKTKKKVKSTTKSKPKS